MGRRVIYNVGGTRPDFKSEAAGRRLAGELLCVSDVSTTFDAISFSSAAGKFVIAQLCDNERFSSSTSEYVDTARTRQLQLSCMIVAERFSARHASFYYELGCQHHVRRR
jgi:hypothetical protein